jgi:DNA helicase-2/ATP-dependent DNA helicase PcrA
MEDTLRNRIAACLQRIALDSLPWEIDVESQKVTVSTIHQAKGLEWPFVFLVQANEGMGGIPNVRSLQSKKYMEEERRLLYVSMTRAKEQLRIVFDATRNESRFLSEIPNEFVNRKLPELLE